MKLIDKNEYFKCIVIYHYLPVLVNGFRQPLDKFLTIGNIGIFDLHNTKSKKDAKKIR